MKNVELYKKANDEIEATEQLKRSTKNKINEKNHTVKFFMAKLANVALIFIFVFSILWLADENKNAKQNELIPIVISGNTKTGSLNKVENIDKLKELIKQSRNNYYNTNSSLMILEDITADSSTQSVPKSATTNKSYSETNVQVKNVDESDIVKTDGNFIYYVANNEVYIIEANSLEIKTKLKYENNEFIPSQIFLAKNKLIVIGSKNDYYNDMKTELSYIMPSKSYTRAIVYDITDRSNVLKLREVSIEGYLLTARMVGDNVYLIANKNILYYANIDDLREKDLLPCYTDTAISQDEKSISINDIYYTPDKENNNSYLILASFNIEIDKEEVQLETILGGGNNVYCSEKNIYIAKTIYNYDLLEEAKSVLGMSNNYTVNTQIYKYALNNGDISFEKDGTVPGYIINQFAMDEHEDFFRIATTKQTNWNSDSSTNNLYVLDKKLDVVGSVQNLAKGERIYSVRFMGKKAYVVTFKQTDPLFVIDLSVPTAPTVLGELKIPGYSTYLHPYDETHLIGFGYNTETVDNGYGEIVRNTGMKIALFDVGDVNNPKELHKVDIGTAGTYSDVLDNHKALLFSKEKNIIAFPITISEKYNIKFQGAIVYGLDIQTGFEEKAKIPNKDNESQDDYRNQIQRILYIKDNLYTLSRSLVKQIDMNTMITNKTVEIYSKNN